MKQKIKSVVATLEFMLQRMQGKGSSHSWCGNSDRKSFNPLQCAWTVYAVTPAKADTVYQQQFRFCWTAYFGVALKWLYRKTQRRNYLLRFKEFCVRLRWSAVILKVTVIEMRLLKEVQLKRCMESSGFKVILMLAKWLCTGVLFWLLFLFLLFFFPPWRLLLLC